MLITGMRACSASSSTIRVRPGADADRVHHAREHERRCRAPTRPARAAAPLRGGPAGARRARKPRPRTRRACEWRACRTRARRSCPSSAREPSRSALSSIARSSRRRCSAVVSSSPVRKCRWVMRVLSWNLYHGRDFPPDPALFTLALAAAADHRARTPHTRRSTARCSTSSRGCWTASTGTWRCCRRRRRAGSRELCRRTPLERRAGAHLAQLAAAAPAQRWPTGTPT